MLKKKNLGQFLKKLLKFLPEKFPLCSQIHGFGIRDPRSGIRKKPIPDPGSRGQKGTGSRIRNTGCCLEVVVRYLRGCCSLAGGITGDRSGRPVILPNSKTQLQEHNKNLYDKEQNRVNSTVRTWPHGFIKPDTVYRESASLSNGKINRNVRISTVREYIKVAQQAVNP